MKPISVRRWPPGMKNERKADDQWGREMGGGQGGPGGGGQGVQEGGAGGCVSCWSQRTNSDAPPWGRSCRRRPAALHLFFVGFRLPLLLFDLSSDDRRAKKKRNQEPHLSPSFSLGFDWVLPSFTGFSKSPMGFDWILLVFTGIDWV